MSKWPCRVGGCVECKTLTGHDLLILDVTLGTLLTASLPFLLFNVSSTKYKCLKNGD